MTIKQYQDPNFLNWDLDSWLPEEDYVGIGDGVDSKAIPSLTQQKYNTVLDVHSTVDASELKLIISTAGNFHRALRRILEEIVFVQDPSLKDSYLLTTSPPISNEQIDTGLVKVGNILFKNAVPTVVMGPGGYLDNLIASGKIGPRTGILQTYGSVILVRKDNNTVCDFWDLRKRRVSFATSDIIEGGSYNNYRRTVENVAAANPRKRNVEPNSSKAVEEAVELRNKLFDEAEKTFSLGLPMHRSTPDLVASGVADAALFFYHLAYTAVVENPDVFDIIPLGEFVDECDLSKGQVPLEGNAPGKQFISFPVRDDLTPEQEAAQTLFKNAMLSPEATAILEEEALTRI